MIVRLISFNIVLEIFAIAVTLHGIYMREYDRARYMKTIGIVNLIMGIMAALVCLCMKYGFKIVEFSVFVGLGFSVLHIIFGVIVGVIGLILTRKGWS